MYFQRGKMQPKLVSCISGHIWDVVVDLRKDSPMFKRWQAFNLTGDECNQVYVPVGCAHGFLTLEDAVVLYKCGEVFYPSILDMVYVNRSRCLQAIKNPSKLQKRSRRVFKAWQNSSPIHRFFYSVGLSCLCKKKRTDKR
ncbi:dTDP-4-dehydrorhamnose 3,5-epimerase [Acutalibacter sp. JLR.KK004]|uniref:dTDP-4-dehydrorhamnose 3,5-epimerase family protein n=1 Tax=Acutalibacter sp. JLR.KK004 TaxID=3112622 RepID=UPI002FEF52A9